MHPLKEAPPPFSGETLFYVFPMLHGLDIRMLWGRQLWGGTRLGGRKSKVPFPWIRLAWQVTNGNLNSVACRKTNFRDSALWCSLVFKQIQCSPLLPLQPDAWCGCLLGNVDECGSTGPPHSILPGIGSWRQRIRGMPQRERREGREAEFWISIPESSFIPILCLLPPGWAPKPCPEPQCL